MEIIRRFFSSEEAQGMVEYILISTVLVIMGYAIVSAYRDAFKSKFDKTANFRAGPVGIGP